MAKDTYEPDQLTITARPADTDLDAKLTGQPAVEDLARALTAAAFEFEQDELMTVSTAEDLQIVDEQDYTRGFDLLNELGVIEDRITRHYNRFDKPLNFLIKTVRALKAPQVLCVSPIKQALQKRLGTWKADQEAKARAERQRLQEEADRAAKVAQQARAEQLERVASQEVNPKLAESFRAEAETVRAADIAAPPVETRQAVPSIPGGYTRTTWKAEVFDLKALMTAYVEGKAFLPDDAIIEKGIQGHLDKQAASLTVNMTKAYPGVKAVPSYGAVARRR